MIGKNFTSKDIETSTFFSLSLSLSLSIPLWHFQQPFSYYSKSTTSTLTTKIRTYNHLKRVLYKQRCVFEEGEFLTNVFKTLDFDELFRNLYFYQFSHVGEFKPTTSKSNWFIIVWSHPSKATKRYNYLNFWVKCEGQN